MIFLKQRYCFTDIGRLCRILYYTFRSELKKSSGSLWEFEAWSLTNESFELRDHILRKKKTNKKCQTKRKGHQKENKQRKTTLEDYQWEVCVFIFCSTCFLVHRELYFFYSKERRRGKPRSLWIFKGKAAPEKIFVLKNIRVVIMLTHS